MYNLKTVNDYTSFYCQENNNAFKVQKSLTKFIESKVRSKFTESLETLQLGWFNSVACEFASYFLIATPSCPLLSLTSSEFTTVLRRRLLLPIPAVSPGMRCHCNSHGSTRTTTDSLASHLVTSCPKNGFGINCHNNFVLSFRTLASACGISSTTEPNNAFANAGPEYSNINLRPDILLSGTSSIALDISQTAPIPIKYNPAFTREHASDTCRAANLRYDAKVLKYTNISSACSIVFQPIVVETTGRLHPKSLDFIKKILSDNINGGYLDGALLRSYWLKRISVSYLKSQAILINNSLSYLNDSTNNSRNFELSDDAGYQSAHLRV